MEFEQANETVLACQSNNYDNLYLDMLLLK